MTAERFLTVPEVAERIRVSTWTVKSWLRSGRLRGYRPGGTKAGWRVKETDLTAFLEQTTNEGEAGAGRPEGDA